MLLIIIDNYDSFTYNLVQLFGEFDIEIEVFRHDAVSPQAVGALKPDWICISPGPRDPGYAGISQALVRYMAGRMPILGVCLGMQVINEVYRGQTIRAPVPVHGKASMVHHDGRGIFAGLPSPFRAARYHSLQVARLSSELEVLAKSEDGVIMGLQHRRLALWGVQFHPESFFSEYGLELAENFLKLAPAFPKADLNRLRGKSGRFPRWEQTALEAHP